MCEGTGGQGIRDETRRWGGCVFCSAEAETGGGMWEGRIDRSTAFFFVPFVFLPANGIEEERPPTEKIRIWFEGYLVG